MSSQRPKSFKKYRIISWTSTRGLKGTRLASSWSPSMTVTLRIPRSVLVLPFQVISINWSARSPSSHPFMINRLWLSSGHPTRSSLPAAHSISMIMISMNFVVPKGAFFLLLVTTPNWLCIASTASIPKTSSGPLSPHRSWSATGHLRRSTLWSHGGSSTMSRVRNAHSSPSHPSSSLFMKITSTFEPRR